MYPSTLLLTLLLQAGDVTIPRIDQPANFSGAAGVYCIAVEAAPTVVRAEDPITLTVKIVSQQPGPWQHPPQRDKLRILPPELNAHFFIEPLPEEDRFIAGENTWVYSWRLVPKHAGVLRIPALEFIYYHTAGSPSFKAADGASSISLDVKPRPALDLTAPPGTREKFQRIVEGEALLARLPEPWIREITIIACVTSPPFLCLVGYGVWRWLFPAAAERLRRHRGRAYRLAIRRLRKLGPSASPAKFRDVIATYLGLHVVLPEGGPTAAELKKAILAHNLPKEAATEAESFFQRCDAALFAPFNKTSLADLHKGATHLLQTLEAGLCALASQ